jgi:hypothetical protein
MKREIKLENVAVEVFVPEMSHLIGYAPVGYHVTQNENLTFNMSSEGHHAGADVCVMDDNLTILLIFQENKDCQRFPEVQLLLRRSLRSYRTTSVGDH